jgi:L-threonylcarbamoyladenylate synthase
VPAAQLLERAARVALAGGTIIFPTDTVYGIGADPGDLAAVERIFVLKVRPRNKPLALHLGSVDEALEYVESPNIAALMRRLLPGAITVLVPRPSFVDPRVTGGLPQLGLRVPDHPLCAALLERTGPLAGTSANRSTFPSYLGNGDVGGLPEADLFVDDGPTPRLGESTIIDLCGDQPRLIREGVIPLATLEAMVGPIARKYPVPP